MARKKRHPAVDAFFQELTSKGGTARMRALSALERKKFAASGGTAAAKSRTAAERSEAARKAARARWAKAKKA